MNYWLIVPAAGKGKRFGGQLPKQYLRLGQSTVMQTTLDRLSTLAAIKQIIVPIHPEDDIAKNLTYQYPQKIRFVTGGAERADSVLAGLEAIKTEAQPDDWVLVHDVARPCVRLTDIQNMFTQLFDDEVGGILAAPVRDTIKQASDDGQNHIIATVPRQQLWQAFTPQMFRFDIIYQALSHALAQQNMVTDEASAVELLGFKPRLINGALDNLKITYPEDLLLAEFLIRQQTT